MKQTALLHHLALVLDRLLIFLMPFSTLILKLSFSQSLSLHSHPLLRFLSCNLTVRCLAVTGGGSVGGCGRLSQPSWLFGALYTMLYSLTKLRTYLAVSVTIASIHYAYPQGVARLSFPVYSWINPLKPNSSNYYTLPYRPNLPILISDIRALWRSWLSARVSECQKLKLVG